MHDASPEEVTRLLQAWNDGEEAALSKLVPLVHQELHRLARRYMRREHAGHTLQTTALVNEAYLRLVGTHAQWRNRTHFFAVSAQIMRRILVDFARARSSEKHGGGCARLQLEDIPLISPERGTDLVALDDALLRLAALNARQARVVELRYFGGLGEAEIAKALRISTRTVRQDWSLARAWLYRELSCSGDRDAT